MSTTLSPEASPIPQTMRSGLVGINLRCRLSSAPSGPIVTTVLKSVVPLKRLSISLIPMTTVVFVLRREILQRLQVSSCEID